MVMKLFERDQVAELEDLLEKSEKADTHLLTRASARERYAVFIAGLLTSTNDFRLAQAIGYAVADVMIKRRQHQGQVNSQGSLFAPDEYLSLDNNQYKKMKYCKHDDLVRHLAVLRKNAEAQRMAFDKNATYFTDRIARLDGTDLMLGDIEK